MWFWNLKQYFLMQSVYLRKIISNICGLISHWPCMKSTISRDEYKESFKRHDYFNKIQENQNFLNYRTFLTTESYEPQNF